MIPRDLSSAVAPLSRPSVRGSRLLGVLLVALLLQGMLAPFAKAADLSSGLLTSTSSDRSNPAALDGATVSGTIYPFTARTSRVKRVQFYVDDPKRSGEPYNTESSAPFDLGGATSGVHNGFDTTKLADGAHTFTAAITGKDGKREVSTAAVTVRNAATAPAPSPQGLLYSTSSNRANPLDLDAAPVSGKIYAFTEQVDGVSRVQFYIDDPARTGAPYNSESDAPFDLGGATSGVHNGYDTTKLADGAHTFTAAITLSNGSVQVVTATPTVANTVTPPPTPTPTLTPTPTPTPPPAPEPTPTPVPTPVPSMDGRLGLHVTEQELAMWRQRAASGPYKASGDRSKYSPGDWDRIVSNKNAFMSKPSSEIFTVPGSGCVTQDTDRPEIYLDKIRDAAFYALVMQDTTVATAVKDQLVKQVGAVNFADTSRWCSSGQGGRKDTDPAFGISHRLTKLLFAYDYVRILGVVPATDQAKIEGWHRAAASWQAVNVKAQIAKANSITGNFAGWSGRESTGYDGGPKIGERAKQYNNRIGAIARYVGLAGVALGDASLTTTGADFYKNWLKYSVYPDGSFGEFERGESGGPEKGTAYSANLIGAATVVADAMARAGDRSLLDYTTSEGIDGTQGKPSGYDGKSLLFAAESIAKYRNGTFNRIKHGDRLNLDADGWNGRNHTLGFAPVNRHWDSSIVESVVTGEAFISGPASLTSSGNSWGGAEAMYPAVMFMFARG